MFAFLFATVILDVFHCLFHYLPSYRGGFFVTAEYHALHHIYPHRFFSSYVKVIDWLFGTAQQLHGKQVVMTGASGALGRHMKIYLEKEGAVVTACKFGADYTYDNYDKLAAPRRKQTYYYFAMVLNMKMRNRPIAIPSCG